MSNNPTEDFDRYLEDLRRRCSDTLEDETLEQMLCLEPHGAGPSTSNADVEMTDGGNDSIEQVFSDAFEFIRRDVAEPGRVGRTANSVTSPGPMEGTDEFHDALPYFSGGGSAVPLRISDPLSPHSFTVEQMSRIALNSPASVYPLSVYPPGGPSTPLCSPTPSMHHQPAVMQETMMQRGLGDQAMTYEQVLATERWRMQQQAQHFGIPPQPQQHHHGQPTTSSYGARPQVAETRAPVVQQQQELGQTRMFAAGDEPEGLAVGTHPLTMQPDAVYEKIADELREIEKRNRGGHNPDAKRNECSGQVGLLHEGVCEECDEHHDQFSFPPTPISVLEEYKNPEDPAKRTDPRYRRIPRQVYPHLMDMKEWLKIYYYERMHQTGNIFTGKTCFQTIYMDGFTSIEDESRFALGAIDNAKREAASTAVRTQIGRGLRVDVRGRDLVVMTVESDSSVFVQSCMAAVMRRDPVDTVYRLCKGQRLAIYEEGIFNLMLQKTFKRPYEHNYALKKLCTLRLSFAKGWGESYKRQTILESPAWIELQLTNPMRKLDLILQAIDEVTEAPALSFYRARGREATLSEPSTSQAPILASLMQQ